MMLSLARGELKPAMVEDHNWNPSQMLTPTRIPILERVELPEELIPADSRVEIDAKITAGEWLSQSTKTSI